MTAWILLANEWAAIWGAAFWRATWQGGLALGLVYALCRLLPGLPPNARCWLWRIAYLKLAAALFWSTPIAVPILPAETPLPARWNSEAPRALGGPALNAELPGPESVPPTAPVAAGTERGELGANLALEPVRPSFLLLLLTVWAVGATTCGARVVRQWRRTTRLRSACRPSDDLGIAQALARLCRRMRLHNTPELLCAEAPGPLVVGVLRPAIVLPAGLQATDAEQECILAHELAHVKRRDLLWAHLPLLTRVLFYFHPLVWLGHREWRLAQEMACDALTLRLTSVSAGDYGELLVKLAACHRARPAHELSVAGILEPGTGLERRLSMLPFSRSDTRRAQVVGAALLTAASLALIPWRVSAQPAAVGAARTPRMATPPVPGPAQDRSMPKPTAAQSTAKKKSPRRVEAKAQKKPPVPAATRSATAAAPSPKREAPANKKPVTEVKPTPKPAAQASLTLNAVKLQETFSLARPLQALTGNPEAKPGDGSGFHAIGINVGPFSSLLEALTPGEFFDLLAAERQAAQAALRVTKARADAGQTAGDELIPLVARVQQLELLMAAADRLRGKAPAPGRADLAQMLTPMEMVQYVRIEIQATMQLLSHRRAQFEAGRLSGAEVAPLETRARQLEILLRAAERRAAPPKGDK